MRKLLFALTCLLSLGSCASMLGLKQYSGDYEYTLTSVECPQIQTEPYGEKSITTTTEDNTLKYIFKDDYIAITWTVTQEKFFFALKNLTDHNIQVIWDEAVYVDVDGGSNRVMHAGVKYSEMNNSQAPTTVAANSILTDVVSPTCNIYYNSTTGWTHNSLLGRFHKEQQVVIDTMKKYQNANLKVILPIKINGIVNEYTFTFTVTGYKLNFDPDTVKQKKGK